MYTDKFEIKTKESSEWNNDLCCNISKITIMENKTVCIDVPDDHCADMSGAYRFCNSIIENPKTIIIRNLIGIMNVYCKFDDGSYRMMYDRDMQFRGNDVSLLAKARNDIEKDVDIVSLIRESINLFKRGSSYIGKCPFHGSITSDFYVTPSLNRWHCFSCGKAGRQAEWIQERYGLELHEALSHLAGRKMIAVSLEVDNGRR